MCLMDHQQMITMDYQQTITKDHQQDMAGACNKQQIFSLK